MWNKQYPSVLLHLPFLCAQMKHKHHWHPLKNNQSVKTTHYLQNSQQCQYCYDKQRHCTDCFSWFVLHFQFPSCMTLPFMLYDQAHRQKVISESLKDPTILKTSIYIKLSVLYVNNFFFHFLKKSSLIFIYSIFSVVVDVKQNIQIQLSGTWRQIIQHIHT